MASWRWCRPFPPSPAFALEVFDPLIDRYQTRRTPALREVARVVAVGSAGGRSIDFTEVR